MAQLRERCEVEDRAALGALEARVRESEGAARALRRERNALLAALRGARGAPGGEGGGGGAAKAVADAGTQAAAPSCPRGVQTEKAAGPPQDEAVQRGQDQAAAGAAGATRSGSGGRAEAAGRPGAGAQPGAGPTAISSCAASAPDESAAVWWTSGAASVTPSRGPGAGARPRAGDAEADLSMLSATETPERGVWGGAPEHGSPKKAGADDARLRRLDDLQNMLQGLLED